MSTDNTWTSMFKVVANLETHSETDVDSSFYVETFQVRNIHNDELVGTYRDEKYAKRQARRKYKKIVQLIENKFMS